MTHRAENPLTLLSKMPGFSTLSLNHQKLLARSMSVKDQLARTHIFYDNETGEGMYLIMEGRVEITTWMGHGKARREAMLQLLYTGDFFGEYSMITGKPRVAAAVAAIPTKLLFLSDSEYQRIRRTDYELTLALHDVLFEGMSVRQQRNNELTRLLRIFPVELRLIKFLTLMARPHEQQPTMHVLDHLTEEQIAMFLNVRRPTLSAALKTLKGEKQELSTALQILRGKQLIDIERRRSNIILIPDMGRLHAILAAKDCEPDEEQNYGAVELTVQEFGGKQAHRVVTTQE